MANKVALFIVSSAGFSEELVDVVQHCGATGATLIPARGTGAKFTKFLGLHYEPEREILLSVVTEELALAIMNQIKAKYGKDTPANAICFTTPVEDSTF